MDSLFVFRFKELHQTTLPAYIFIRLWQIIYISIFFNTLPPTPRFYPAPQPFFRRPQPLCRQDRMRRLGATQPTTGSAWRGGRQSLRSHTHGLGFCPRRSCTFRRPFRRSGIHARPTRFQTASSAANAPAPPEAARQTAAGLYYNPPLPYPRTQQCIL